MSHQMQQKHHRVVKKFHDELASNHIIEDPVKGFEVKVFRASLDVVINQLQIRFPLNLINLSTDDIRIKEREFVGGISY